jgi:hypothetical protein
VEWIPNTDFGWHNTIITAIVGMRNSFTQWGFWGIRGGRVARGCQQAIMAVAGIKKGRNHTLISTFLRLLRSLKEYNSIR